MKNPNASPTLKRGFGLSSFGRSAEFRTLGLVVPNHARYQLRHTPIIIKFLTVTCKGDSALLRLRYQLSVRNIVALLAWSASHCSVFLPAPSLPSSATGGGNA